MGRIYQLRNVKNEGEKPEGKAYSLAQLRNIKNTKELLGDGDLETMLGINNEVTTIDEPILAQIENGDGYTYSFKPQEQK